MKLVNLSFHIVTEGEFAIHRHRHLINKKIFSALHNSLEVKHLQLVYRLPSGRFVEDNDFYFRSRSKYISFPLLRFLRKLKPDIVFAHSFNFPVQLLILQFLLPKTTKFIIQHHAEKPFRGFFRHLFQKWVYSRAHLFLFASRDLAVPFIERGVIKNAAQVREIMEISTDFSPIKKNTARHELDFSGATFLWVGRLDQNKDPLTVLKAIDKLRNTGVGFRLYMLYSSKDMEIQVREFVHGHQLSEFVKLVGFTLNKELPQWFSAADYYISASHYEGSGVALCEAMACGCVPIVTNIPSFKTMTRNGECGFLYPPGDSDRLAAILEEAINTSAYEKLSEKALQIFREDLSYEAISRKLYEEVTRLMAKLS